MNNMSRIKVRWERVERCKQVKRKEDRLQEGEIEIYSVHICRLINQSKIYSAIPGEGRLICTPATETMDIWKRKSHTEGAQQEIQTPTPQCLIISLAIYNKFEYDIMKDYHVKYICHFKKVSIRLQSFYCNGMENPPLHRGCALYQSITA